MTLHATWFDGRSSGAHAVELLLSEATLQVLFAGERSQAWPLDAVVISPRLGNTPRILRFPDGSRVEVADAPALEVAFGASVGRIDVFSDWLERRRAAIVGAAVATVVAVLLFVQFGVPWLALEIAERMPPAVERHVSVQVVALLERARLGPSTLPHARQASLRQAFARMVADEPRSGDIRVSFAHAPRIGPNAFTLPDGRIYVTDELVALAGSDAEVLAVLAHEAGHHVHRHGMRQAIESSSVFVLAGLLFGDPSGSSLAVSIPAVLLGNGFSRGHEREADAYAVDLLRRHGQSPRAFARIMRRMSADMPKGLDEGPIGYLSSHPPSPERIAAAEQAAADD